MSGRPAETAHLYTRGWKHVRSARKPLAILHCTTYGYFSFSVSGIAMNRFGKWVGALAVTAAVVGMTSYASAAIVQTRISLNDFKKALGVRSVGVLTTQTPIPGVKFWINKKTGTVTFRVNTSVYDGTTPITFTANATKRGTTTRSTVTAELFGDPTKGIFSVRGAGGSVSPT